MSDHDDLLRNFPLVLTLIMIFAVRILVKLVRDSKHTFLRDTKMYRGRKQKHRGDVQGRSEVVFSQQQQNTKTAAVILNTV